MNLGEPEALQVRLKGLNLKEIVNEKFLQYLNEELTDIKVIDIMIATGSEEKQNRDQITLQHPTLKYEKDNIILIDTNKPETLEKTVRVIKNYKKLD